MEWVETTGKTLADAKNVALDQLGVDEQDAEFEVLDEPRPGLFGRMRGEARVRARVRPTHPRPKVERRRGRKADSDTRPAAAQSARGAATPRTAGKVRTSDDNGAAPKPPTKRSSNATKAATARPVVVNGEEPLMSDATTNTTPTVDEATAATEFLRGLLEAMGLSGEVAVAGTDDDVDVTVDGEGLGLLIGPGGATLQAVQELTRLAVQQRRGGERGAWIHVDISGYRAKRRVALEKFTAQVAAQVVDSGAPRALEPMSAADRKIVHDTASGIAGVRTTSEGEDPHRRVVLHPAD